MSSDKSPKNKKAIWDLIYCIAAVGLMNVVLQFAVYPIINNKIGESAFGDVLFLLGVMNILAPSFGLAVNNTRLVFPNRDKTCNGDYVRLLFLYIACSVPIIGVVSISRHIDIVEIVLFACVIGSAIIRNYACVEYRLSLNYKQQFVFYLVLSVGYILGMLLFWKTGKWYFVFIVGECLAIAYVVLTGTIFKGIFKTSPNKNKIMKNATTLSGSYLLTNIMMNLDRIVLLYIVDSVAVSQYYVLSLIGKTIAIISGPVNSVLIGYITKMGKKIDGKLYRKVVGIVCGFGVLCFVACAIVSPIFIKLLYPNLYGDIIQLNIIVNASQILYFLTNLLLTVILTFAYTKWQLIIQGIYSVLFVVFTVVGTFMTGVAGYSYATLIANAFYLMLTIFVGWYFSRNNQKEE